MDDVYPVTLAALRARERLDDFAIRHIAIQLAGSVAGVTGRPRLLAVRDAPRPDSVDDIFPASFVRRRKIFCRFRLSCRRVPDRHSTRSPLIIFAKAAAFDLTVACGP